MLLAFADFGVGKQINISLFGFRLKEKKSNRKRKRKNNKTVISKPSDFELCPLHLVTQDMIIGFLKIYF